MGSFTSAPKILNEDTQDADVVLPPRMSRDELLQHCHQQLEDLPALVKRSFRRLRQQLGDTTHGLRVLQWNILSRGTDRSCFVRVLPGHVSPYTDDFIFGVNCSSSD
jgi:hypothetical protein